MNILAEYFIKKENIVKELKHLDVNQNETDRILKLSEEIGTFKLLQIILERLEEEDKKLFLEHFYSGTPEAVTMFLREKIENVETILKEQSALLEQEILNDISKLKE